MCKVFLAFVNSAHYMIIWILVPSATIKYVINLFTIQCTKNHKTICYQKHTTSLFCLITLLHWALCMVCGYSCVCVIAAQVVCLGSTVLLLHQLCQCPGQWWHQTDVEQLHVRHCGISWGGQIVILSMMAELIVWFDWLVSWLTSVSVWLVLFLGWWAIIFSILVKLKKLYFLVIFSWPIVKSGILIIFPSMV